MSDSRRTLKALHQLALAHLGPASAALKTREALEAALAAVLAQQAAPALPLPPVVRGFEVRAPLVVKAPFRSLEAPVLPGPFGDDQVLVFPRDAGSVMASWDLSRRGAAVLQVREGGAVLRRIEGLAPMGTLQLDGLFEAHTISIELVQGARTVGRSKPLTLPGRPARQPQGANGAARARATGGAPVASPADGALAAQRGGAVAERWAAGNEGFSHAAADATAATQPAEAGFGRARQGKLEPASSRAGEGAAEAGSSRASPRRAEPAASRSSLPVGRSAAPVRAGAGPSASRPSQGAASVAAPREGSGAPASSGLARRASAAPAAEASGPASAAPAPRG